MTGAASTSAPTAAGARATIAGTTPHRRGAFSAAEGCHDATGGVAGGQIGYRWQSGAWVFGLEAQGDWADLSGSNVSLLLPPALPTRSRIDAFGLFTGQIGYAWNNALLYAKGGAAVTDNSYSYRPAPVTFWRSRRAIKPAGAARSAPVSNSASRRTGRRPSNTIICSWATAPCDFYAITAPVVLFGNDKSARTSISSPFASTTAGVAR